MNMILDSPSEPMQPPPSAPALPAGSLEMRMEKVHFSYGEGQPKILSDISFEATSGQMVAIVGRSGAQAVGPEQVAEMWARSTSDPELFTRALLGLHFNEAQDGRSSRDLFLGNPDRAAHTHNYIRIFNRLIDEAHASDPGGMIADALAGSAMGLLYAVMREHRDGIPAPRYQTR